ncbi:MAG: hypothetical protein OJF50_004940 [Nitrospira sp.]|nr:hypothetical protein [Nitrospira sp.]
MKLRRFGGEHPRSTVWTNFPPDLVGPASPSGISFYQWIFFVWATPSSTMMDTMHT